MFEKEIDAIKDRRYGRNLSVPQKLCAMLAVTLTMAQDNYWLYDNEFEPELLEKLIKDLGTCVSLC